MEVDLIDEGLVSFVRGEGSGGEDFEIAMKLLVKREASDLEAIQQLLFTFTVVNIQNALSLLSALNSLLL